MRDSISDSSFSALDDADCTTECMLGCESGLSYEQSDSCPSSSSGIVKMRSSDVADLKLPDEVVERILGMIPFPQLLKVRSLSKAWYNKFPRRALKHSDGSTRNLHPQPSKNCDMDGSSSLSFQSLVSSVSARWSIYCPVILGDEGLSGYDSTQKRWQELCTDLRVVLGTTMEPWLISSCGPLICGVSQSRSSVYDVFITNVLTGRWRKLPPRPNTKAPSLLNLFFDTFSSGYKVFLVTEDPYEGPYDDCTENDFSSSTQRSLCSQIFNSAESTWTMTQSDVSLSTSFAWRSCGVYFDQNIYCLSGDDRNPLEFPIQVWMYCLKDGMWTEINHPFEELVNVYSGMSVLFDLTRFKLIVCGSKIMVTLAVEPQQPYVDQVRTDSLFIYELDPVTKFITEKSRGPSTTLMANSEHIASDGSSIYFCTLDLRTCSTAVVYNVKSGEWNSLVLDFKTSGHLRNRRWAEFAFQPGLNPFLAP